MDDKTYDRLKWFALIFIPAFVTLILTIGKIWSIPYYTEVGATVAAIGVFIGAVIGVSSHNYYNSKNEGENENDTGNDSEETAGEDS